MKTAEQSFVLWLLPEEKTAKRLDALIETLAHQHSSPQFASHATLCRGLWSGPSTELRETIDQLARHSHVIDVDTLGLDQTDRFFQYLFISLEPNPIQSLAENARKFVPSVSSPKADPHLSLMYSEDDAGIDRERIKKELTPKIPSRIRFTALQLVTAEGNRWDDVRNWRRTHTSPLGQAVQ